jgi:hypothetical protein
MGHEYMEVNGRLTIHGRENENIVEPINDNNSLVWLARRKDSAGCPQRKQIRRQSPMKPFLLLQR